LSRKKQVEAKDQQNKKESLDSHSNTIQSYNFDAFKGNTKYVTCIIPKLKTGKLLFIDIPHPPAYFKIEFEVVSWQVEERN